MVRAPIISGLVMALYLLGAAPVVAQAPAAADDGVLADRSAWFPSSNLFVLELDGSFRWRTELWHDVHLGLPLAINTWGVYPQISEQAGGADPAAVRELTDFRLRLLPTLHVSQRAQVKMVIDLLSVQAGEGGDSALASVVRGSYGIDPAGSLNSPLNSAAVRMAWVEMRVFNLLDVIAGRVPAQWGLGLVENAGFDPEADGGDAVDGITARVRLPGNMEVSISLDWPLEGATVHHPTAPWGAGIDPGDTDDIWQWRVRFISLADPKADTRLEWGLYARVRWHDFSSLGGDNPAEACQSPYPWEPVLGCAEMFWRDAFTVTPDAFFRFSTPLSPDVRLELAGEVAGRYGWVNSTQQFSGRDTSKDLYGLGGALRAELQFSRAHLGIDFAAASGDGGSRAFGVLDRPILAEPDDSAWEGSPVAVNQTVTSFALHPNFIVDRILYRRVVGAVTNSFFVKPYGKVTLWQSGDSSLWLQAYAMYARAFVATSTPGNAYDLGLEADAGLGGQITSHAYFLADFAVLFPLAGLADASALKDPVPWAGRFLLNLTF